MRSSAEASLVLKISDDLLVRDATIHIKQEKENVDDGRGFGDSLFSSASAGQEMTNDGSNSNANVN